MVRRRVLLDDEARAQRLMALRHGVERVGERGPVEEPESRSAPMR